MDDLLELLLKIEKRPALYIGNTDLICLSQFLNGYCFAKLEENDGFGKWLNGEFRIFLAERYSDNSTNNWAGLIIKYEENGNSTDTFYKLLHEYLADRAE